MKGAQEISKFILLMPIPIFFHTTGSIERTGKYVAPIRNGRSQEETRG